MRSERLIGLCILCFVLCTFLVGCRPRGILYSGQMRDVMIDLHKTDALLQVAGINAGKEEVRAIYYAQVMEKHGITQAEFDSSLVWYTAHPKLFDKIYPKVLAELRAEEAAFLALHSTELNIGEAAKEENAEVIIRPFTHAQLDSVLWVTQHGYPHSWNPLVHDLEDQFFPQISVLR